MARVKWNAIVNSVDTNLNNVQKNPPDCLKNTSRNGGRMPKPFFNDAMAKQLAVFNSRPPALDLNVSSVQPGRSSREDTFNYNTPPGAAGDNSKTCWPGNPTDGPDGRTQVGIQSNLTDIPSQWGRKYTSQK